MLPALIAPRRTAPDPAQLSLAIEACPANSEELLERLRGFGLHGIESCRLTRNRTVMVSYRGTELRVNEGYLAAPPELHRAIVAFVCGRTRRERVQARRVIAAHAPIAARPSGRPPPRRPEMHPADRPLAARLRGWHERFNEEHFGGALQPIAIRVSRRMRRRLGHYMPGSEQESAEIAISRRHVRRDGFDESLRTLLHEMVHQWQHETGQPLDHGRAFRARARAVGIPPRAILEHL